MVAEAQRPEVAVPAVTAGALRNIPNVIKDRLKESAQFKWQAGDGLYLLMNQKGGKWWRWDYRRPGTGKRNTLSLGTYPTTGLADARERLSEARKALAAGIDPGAVRKAAQTTAKEADREAANTFAAVAEAWAKWKGAQVKENTASKNRWLLDTYLLPDLGPRPIREILPRELLTVLRKIEDTGKLEAAKRAKIKAGEVFRYAVLEGLADSDPTASLKGALKAPNTRHHAAITDPAKIGGLMRSIDGYSEFVARHALLILALTFVRPGELDRPAFRRHSDAIIDGNDRGVYGQQQAVHG